MNKSKYDEQTRMNIVSEYQSGQSISSVANHYGCATATVIRILKENNINIRTRGNVFTSVTEQEVQEISRSWQEGESQTSIAKKYKLTQSNVSRLLNKIGFQVEHRQPRREKHGRWKGGIHIDHNGYRHIKLQPEDEFFVMTNTGGYVPEHRYVMAKSVARPLLTNETVHHIDGNRLNNSLSNLQLRQGQHGSGVVHICLNCGSHNVKPISLK